MSLVTVLDNEYATLWYHTTAGVVHHKFKHAASGQHFREVLERGVELLRERDACKWLSDDRGNSALTPDDSLWAHSSWESRAIAVGWKYWAIVLPIEVVGRMDMARNIAAMRGRGVDVRVFSDPAEALEWLESL